MKKTIFVLILSIFLFAGVNAEYKVYNNVEDFEKDKGAICESATDGCNTFFLTDGKVMGGTKMYCQNYAPEWTCLKYKEDSISTMSIEPTTTSINTEEAKICTMEYAPVCAQVQVQCIKAPCNPILQTFSNTCMAGDNKILYKGECNTKLSENDLNLYNSIKTSKLDNIYQDKVYNLLNKFKTILSLYSVEDQTKTYNLILKVIDKYLNDITKIYSQDLTMNKNDNIKYLMLKLLKFELVINHIDADNAYIK